MLNFLKDPFVVFWPGLFFKMCLNTSKQVVYNNTYLKSF